MHRAVSNQGHHRCRLNLAPAAHLWSRQQPDGLRPSEGILAPLSRLEIHGVFGMAGHVSLDCGAAALLDILRDVHVDVQHSQLTDKSMSSVALVPAEGGTLRSGQILERLSRCAAFGSAIVLRDLYSDAEAVADFTRRVTQGPQLRARALIVFSELCFHLGCPGARVGGPRLPAEVPLVIAGPCSRTPTRAVLGTDAFVRGLWVNHRPVDSEVCVVEQPHQGGLFHDDREQRVGNIRPGQRALVFAQSRPNPCKNWRDCPQAAASK